jgi:hypothetical protein
VSLRELQARHVVELGLVFQVSGALGVAVREFWHGVPLRSGIAFLVPGECVWLLAYTRSRRRAIHPRRRTP